jgi:hypothetical protein
METGVMDFAAVFGPVKDTVLSAVTAVVPLGIAILGVILAVRKGVSLIKGVSGR